MPSFSEIATAAPWLFPSTFSLIGVLIGAGLALLTQRGAAKRAHRRELALSALEAVTNARGAVSAARSRAGRITAQWESLNGVAPLDASEPFQDAEVATAIWARFEMLAALERYDEDRRAVAASGMVAHEWLMSGARSTEELQKLGGELQRLSVILVAWERGKAKGRDFRLSLSDAYKRFGPQYTDADLPPLG